MHEAKDLSRPVDRARQAMHERDWAESCRLWESVLATPGFSAADCVDAARSFRELSRYDEAEEVLTKAAKTFPDAESVAVARCWMANARADWPEALNRWANFQTRFPMNPWGYLGGLHALRAAGRADQIASILPSLANAVSTAKQSNIDPESALKLDIEVAKAQSDWAAVRSLTEPATAQSSAPSVTALIALAQAYWHLGDCDEADDAARRALSVDASLSEAVVVRAWVATGRGDSETALSCYRKLAQLNPGAVRWSLKVIQLLNRTGHVKDALVELNRVRQQWPNDPMVRVFLQNYGPAAEGASTPTENATHDTETRPGGMEEDELRIVAGKAPGSKRWRRPLVVADGEKDVLLAPVPGAETGLLVFTGSNDAVSMPLPLFDRYLATLDITVVYLKDLKRLRFLTGIGSLSDAYEGTLTALREALHRIGIKRIFTLGNCDGGFAAIRYGIELGAERIVAFGAPTHTDQKPSTKIEQARNFMKTRLADKVPSAMLDLKPFLACREYTTKIDLFYEEEDARDSMQALHLAGLPGIRLHPQPGLSNHYLLRQFALTQENFAEFLADLLAGESRTNVQR